MPVTLRIGLLLSGNGSVLQTLLSAIGDGSLDAKVEAVVTNRDCPALGVATRAGIPMLRLFDIADFASKAGRDAAMGAFLVSAGVELAIVGGYSEHLDEAFFQEFGDNIIGMYPALLPAFAELPEAVGPALEYGVKVIGVTVHYRTANSGSAGAIIAQEPIPVTDDDTIQSVEKRIIELERWLLPQVLAQMSLGQIVRDGHRVKRSPHE